MHFNVIHTTQQNKYQITPNQQHKPENEKKSTEAQTSIDSSSRKQNSFKDVEGDTSAIEVRNELVFANLSSDELPDIVIEKNSQETSVVNLTLSSEKNGPFAISTPKRNTNLPTSPGMSPVTNDNLSN